MEPVYLDHQASTPLDAEVLEAMLPWMSLPGNPHSSEHAIGRAGMAAVEQARAQVADLVGSDPEDVVFTSGATEAVNLVLRSFSHTEKRLAASAIEHACVLETMHRAAKLGVSVSEIAVDENGIVELDAVQETADRCDLLAVMAVNNEIGTVQPIADIAAVARSAGSLYLCDAAQAAGRIGLDQKASGIDYLTLSAHKLYGPQGIGALSAPRHARERLVPQITGGGQQRGLRSGTLPVALCVGFGAASAIARREMARDDRHATELRDLLLDELERGVGPLGVNGSLDERVPHNLSIRIPGVDADELLASTPAIAMSTGSACSSGALSHSHVLRAIGLDPADASSSIRIGFGRRTTREQVVWAASAIVDAVTALRGKN